MHRVEDEYLQQWGAPITVMKIAGYTVGANRGLKTVLSEKPIKIEKVEKKILDRQILRLAVIAELDAISLYEQLAEATENEAIRRVLLDVAREEKTHVGEFQTLLLIEDEAQRNELQKGEQEVKEELKI
jgi:rubrerythrin